MRLGRIGIGENGGAWNANERRPKTAAGSADKTAAPQAAVWAVSRATDCAAMGRAPALQASGARTSGPRNRRKRWAAAALAWTLAVGQTLFAPWTGGERAYATTVITPRSSLETSSVYEGQVRFSFEFDDPPEGVESHPTVISLCGGPTLATGTYPVRTLNWFTWDTRVGGQPAAEGTYSICVTPTDAAEFGDAIPVVVRNPNPPAPTYVRLVPNVGRPEWEGGSDMPHRFQIEGVAERGTSVRVDVRYVSASGETRETVSYTFAVAPREPGDAWWADKPIDAGDFLWFPLVSAKRPDELVGRWLGEIELRPYEIASITATAIRAFDGKASVPSAPVRVLHYEARHANVLWDALAAYYYRIRGEDEATVERLKEASERIARDNGLAPFACEGGADVCWPRLLKGQHVLVFDPLADGEVIQNADTALEETIAFKYGRPVPLDGDPVNLATWDFGFRHTNLELAGRMPIVWTIAYHSREAYNGALGVGWHHAYEWHVEEREASTVYVTTPEGVVLPFRSNGDGTYRRPAGTFEALEKGPDGAYRLTTPQGVVYRFRADGSLLEIADRNGNRTTLRYEGTLLAAIETEGAWLRLDYGVAGKIRRVTDHTGRYVEWVDEMIYSRWRC